LSVLRDFKRLDVDVQRRLLTWGAAVFYVDSGVAGRELELQTEVLRFHSFCSSVGQSQLLVSDEKKRSGLRRR
jgi:hypothetical protein